jgi:DNA-binding transcriptional regulator YhcF (GntR family)
MRDLFEKIHELQELPSYSKHDQLVQGVINAIDEKLLSKDDVLPSVNKMIAEFGFARETIVKGYRDLKERGIIESHNRLGYYVANEDTGQKLKVALLMFAFDTFQKVFFNSFRDALGENVQLDVFFHHSNIEVFETILGHIRGRYGMYVVSPMPHPRTAGLLQQIPTSKFLMFDRFEPMEGDFCYVAQEFEASTYQSFVEVVEQIRAFDEFLFYYHPMTDIPIEILRSFKKFVNDFNIKGEARKGYKSGSVQKGKAYFVIDNIDLFALIKDCKSKSYVIGKDVGILSHNDEPMKEIIADGITTYSTDFALMGEKAAHFVLTREKIQEILPTVLIKRNSL